MVEYEVGDIIEYGPLGGGVFVAKVKVKSEDIKGNSQGFLATLIHNKAPRTANKPGSGVWGYDEDVIRVVRRANA